MHSIDSWPCKKVFNSLLFCFVLFFPPFPFLKALPNTFERSKWSWLMVIFLSEILFLARVEGLSWFIFVSYVFSKISVFLICQWLTVVVWTLTQNTDHDFKEWTKSLLRNSFVLTWGLCISIDFLLYVGFSLFSWICLLRFNHIINRSWLWKNSSDTIFF